MDFSKAFDKVSHDKLLHKIRYYVIGGKTNTWISAFLCSRSQQVVVNGQTSQLAGVLSGVPQGSVLGPMLFLIYINDIAEGVTSQMRMFAGDSIVYRQIHTPADHFTLASDLNKLLCWAKTWQMDFNVSKCAVLPVTAMRNISAYKYFMGSQIPRTDNQDYLGVTINTALLSWQPHINKVQNEASKTLGLLKRTLHAAPPQVRQTVYEVLVRPTLEFATKTGIQTIERVQRSAARFVTGDYRRTACVSDICTNLMWNSLYTRRRIRDATMFLFKFTIITSAYLSLSPQQMQMRAPDANTITNYEPYQPLARPTSNHSTHCGTHILRKLSPRLPQNCSREPPLIQTLTL